MELKENSKNKLFARKISKIWFKIGPQGQNHIWQQMFQFYFAELEKVLTR